MEWKKKKKYNKIFYFIRKDKKIFEPQLKHSQESIAYQRNFNN